MTYRKGGIGKGPSRLTCDGWKCTAELTGGLAKYLRRQAREKGWRKIKAIGDRCPMCQPNIRRG